MNSLRQTGLNGRLPALSELGLVLAALAVAYTFVTHAADRSPGAVRWDGEAFDATCWTAAICSHVSSTGEIARLIRQLRDGDFKKREQAGKMILDFGTAAEVQLAQAAGDPDPELSNRAAAALEVLRVRATKRTNAKGEPHPVLALALPADIAERNMALGMLGESIIALQDNLTEISPCLPTAIDESRPAQIPFFLLMAERYWHPVPVWIGPRMVPIPAGEEQAPLQPALDLVEYDLLAELDERWQPTTPRAKARVQAVAHYLSKGGQLHEYMFPPVPIPVWVDVLRLRFAQGDTAALAGLFWMDAAPPVEELLRLLKDAKDPARAPILGCLAKVDLKPHVGAVRDLLNGHYRNDAPLLGMLFAAGITIDPAKLKYTAAEIVEADDHCGYSLLRYCRSAGIKAPDGLVDVLLQNEWIDESSLCLLTNLLSESQKGSLKRRLNDRAMPAREQFHARCLLFLNGEKEQEEHLLKFVPPGTPFNTRYYNERPNEYPVVILNQFASYGLFPARTEMLLQQDLFQTSKIGPSVGRMLHGNATPAQKAEVLRKLDNKSAIELAGLLSVWKCKESLPLLIQRVDAVIREKPDMLCYMNAVNKIDTFDDPIAGPCLVRVFDKLENCPESMAIETRMKTLEILLRIGAGFPEGKKTMLRVIDNERRYSALRMVALAGLARISPEDGLARMLKEVEEAPPMALAPLLDQLAATRLPGSMPTLKKHLSHRYPPVAMAAAAGLMRIGDGSGLPVVHKLCRRHNTPSMIQGLLTYWKPDTPPDQVKMIRECLEAYSLACAERPCVTRDDYCQEFGFYLEE